MTITEQHRLLLAQLLLLLLLLVLQHAGRQQETQLLHDVAALVARPSQVPHMS